MDTPTRELFDARIKSSGINFRGVHIGDNLSSVILKEGIVSQGSFGFANYSYLRKIKEALKKLAQNAGKLP